MKCPRCKTEIDFERFVKLSKMRKKQTARHHAEVVDDPTRWPLDIRITAGVDRIPRFLVEYARLMNTNSTDLTGKARFRRLVIPRHAVMWFLGKHSGLTLETIGRIFDRDHSSVYHAQKKIEDLLETGDSETAFAVEAVNQIALEIWPPRVR